MTSEAGEDSAMCCGKKEKAKALHSTLVLPWILTAFFTWHRKTQPLESISSLSCVFSENMIYLFLDQGQRDMLRLVPKLPKVQEQALLSKDELFSL